jgi:hypothetical protein
MVFCGRWAARRRRRNVFLTPERISDAPPGFRRHGDAVGRVAAEAVGLGWTCERELREGQGGRPLHLSDGVVVSKDDRGKEWRTAVEVELTRKTEARVVAILRHLLAGYDDVVYRAAPGAATVVQRAAAGLPGGGAARVHVRPYPPPTLAAVA